MTTELEELKRLANAATPGPWFQVGHPWNQKGDFVCAGSEDPHIGKYVADTEDFDGEVENSFENAAFIAAANPQAIIDLIRRLEEAQAEIEALGLALGNSGNRHEYKAPSGMVFVPEDWPAKLEKAQARISELEAQAVPEDVEWICALEVRMIEIAGMLPGQEVAHAVSSLRNRVTEKKWAMLAAAPSPESGAA